MKILLTNDDGYTSLGLKALQKALEKDHEVWVCAPDGERSGMSHYISLKNPIKLIKHGERFFSSSGSPADCVILALNGLLGFKPDVVVSGINRGPNLGTDLIYSGTAAAARQAALMEIPGIAVSLAVYEEPYLYDGLAGFMAERLDYFISLWNPDIFININGPAVENGTRLDAVLSRPSVRRYRDTLKVFEAADDHSYCFFTDGTVEGNAEKDNDEYAITQGKVSVSRVWVQPRAVETDSVKAAISVEAGLR